MPPVDPDVYEEAFRRTETPALIADTNFVIQDVNRAGLEFTGYEYDEMVGEPATIISADPEIYEDIVDNLLDDEPWSGTFKLLTRDESVVYGRGSTTPIVVDGETRGYVAVFVDTTKQRQYKNAAEVLNRLLRHDLRNELNLVQGYVQQALERIDDPEVEEALSRVDQTVDDIVHKSRRARDLRDLLERSFDASNHAVGLDTVLREELAEARRRYPDAEFYAENIPSVDVIADDLLSTTVEAILDNAVKHNDADVPVVKVRVETDDESARVRIADNGPGVPQGLEDAIFGREELDQLHHGTGISLFFVDNVIRSYDGEVWVETPETGGAEFVVELQLV